MSITLAVAPAQPSRAPGGEVTPAPRPFHINPENSDAILNALETQILNEQHINASTGA